MEQLKGEQMVLLFCFRGRKSAAGFPIVEIKKTWLQRMLRFGKEKAVVLDRSKPQRSAVDVGNGLDRSVIW